MRNEWTGRRAADVANSRHTAQKFAAIVQSLALHAEEVRCTKHTGPKP
jgi:hypothetical protein